MKEFFEFLYKLISGMLPFSLLIVCGLFITLKNGFFQFSKFGSAVKLLMKAFRYTKKRNKGVSSYQAACTALSGTVGTGNIIGVAGALVYGGAGAVFWMWISAFLGMAIKYIEILLSVKYRESSIDGYVGGPMYYITNGLGNKFKKLSLIFSVFLIPAVICTGNITQTNSAVLFITHSTFLKITMGVVFALLVSVVVLGGSERICAFTEKIVPLMSVVYVALCLGIIIKNYNVIPQAFLNIFKGAFSPRSVTGGAVGGALSCFITGASRGVFSNEAGLGTSAMAHSIAVDAKEESQGLYGLLEVFIDTILICTLTALTILCSGVNIEYGKTMATQLVGTAFSVVYGKTAGILLSVMMLIFAFSSIVGWGLYGKLGSEFLFGKRGSKIFLLLYPLICIFGAVCEEKFAWQLSEFFNGCLLCINLPVLLLLHQNSRGAISVRNKN